MSSRPQLVSYQVIKDGDMSGDIISSVTIIEKLSLMAYTYSWIGTSPVGQCILQISNDYKLNPDGSVANAGTWVDLPAVGMVSGDTGNGIIDVLATGAYAMRTKFVFTSGIGLMQAFLNAKVS